VVSNVLFEVIDKIINKRFKNKKERNVTMWQKGEKTFFNICGLNCIKFAKLVSLFSEK